MRWVEATGNLYPLAWEPAETNGRHPDKRYVKIANTALEPESALGR